MQLFCMVWLDSWQLNISGDQRIFTDKNIFMINMRKLIDEALIKTLYRDTDFHDLVDRNSHKSTRNYNSMPTSRIQDADFTSRFTKQSPLLWQDPFQPM